MQKLFSLLLLLALTQMSTIMQAQSTVKSKKATPVYLTKNDPVYLSIKGRLINDLVQSATFADTASERNRSISKRLRSLPEERQEYYQNLFMNSLRDYNAQVHFDFGTFMMLYNDLIKKDQKTLVTESDLRILSLGKNKYAAELWEDGVLANSEAAAMLWAQALIKRFPDGDEKSTIKEVKATYAKARKEMLSGKQQRYFKLIAFLYTKEKDGTVLFHDPGQVMLDLKESDIN
ncbi:MAG: hypothetical protein JWP69_687 [Flaviaesturariibacter sp.]|nr:hypothetical protein [Flaviaesturariibacter sp.]